MLKISKWFWRSSVRKEEAHLITNTESFAWVIWFKKTFENDQFRSDFCIEDFVLFFLLKFNRNINSTAYMNCRIGREKHCVWNDWLGSTYIAQTEKKLTNLTSSFSFRKKGTKGVQRVFSSPRTSTYTSHQAFSQLLFPFNPKHKISTF